MDRSRKLRVLLVGALIGSLLIVGSGEQPAAAAYPTAPTSPTATVSGSTATVSWTPPTVVDAPARLYYEVVARDTGTSPSTYFGESWACAGCNHVEWPALLAGHTYSFTIRAVNQQFEPSTTSVTTSVTVPAAGCPSPPTSDLCVTVDATDVGAPNRFVASGLNHGTSTSSSPTYSSYVQPLNVHHWRLTAGSSTAGQTSTWSFLNANSFSPSTTAILDNLWIRGNLTRPCGSPLLHQPPAYKNPWNDFTFYRSWLAARVADEITADQEPTYWDAMNEESPAGPFKVSTNIFCPDAITATNLKNYLYHTADVLHGLGQKVIASGWEKWENEVAFGQTDTHTATYNSTFDPVVNLNDLLNFSDTMNIAWDGISYHHLDSGYNQADEVVNYRGTPRAVITNASQARALIENHLPRQANAGLFVNEYLGGAGPEPGGHNAAGRLAGFFFGATVADPVEANLTCAPFGSGGNPGTDDCANGSLDGLLDIDGSGNPSKRPAWWVYKAYGEMAGDLVEAASTDSTLTALSAYDDTLGSETVRILLGRYAYATRGVADALLKLKPPTVMGSNVTLSIQPIPNGTGTNAGYGTLSSLPSPLVCNDTVNGSGIVETFIDDFPDNDAYVVTMTAQSGSHPACP